MTDLTKMAEKKANLRSAFVDAVKSGDEEAQAKAFVELSEGILEEMQSAAATKNANQSVLAARGVRLLTADETNYYTQVIDAMKSEGSVKSLSDALTGTDAVMPKTVIDQVMEDITKAHPLLSAIDFINTSWLTEWILNTHEEQSAQWGELDGEITKRLSSGFKRVSLGQYKLSAYFMLPKSALDLGPTWFDAYIRAILTEALAVGMETGIVAGDGDKMPIGMTCLVDDEAVTTGGKYAKKDKVPLESFDPASYGELIADNFARDSHGVPRTVSNLGLIVNPIDYYRRIMPATTFFTPSGTYARDIFPVPTTVYQSTAVKEGEAVMGIMGRYWMGMGLARNGRIEVSDEYKFLEDERTYLIKTYGNGRPKDNCSFVPLDITGLRTPRLAVYTGTAPEGSGEIKPPIPVEVPADDVEQLGKRADALQEGIRITSNRISGTLHYVTDFQKFSSAAEKQKGNFLMLTFDGEVETEVIGGNSDAKQVKDGYCIYRITDAAKQKIRVTYTAPNGVKNEKIYSLGGLKLESEN